MKNWNLKILLIPPLIMTALFLSWILPIARPFWNAVDRNIFYFLNEWIRYSPFWQNFWAVAGHRITDWFHDCVIFLFFFFNIKYAISTLKKRKIAELLFMVVLLLVTVYLITISELRDVIHISRKSPTMVLPDAFHLSKVVDWISVKDHSKKSFPGDHGTTAFLFVCVTFYFMGIKKGFLALLYSIFFCLPRLVAGAHWLTDVFIGSGTIAVSISSIAFGTPIAKTCVNLIEKGLKRLKPLAEKDAPST